MKDVSRLQSQSKSQCAFVIHNGTSDRTLSCKDCWEASECKLRRQDHSGAVIVRRRMTSMMQGTAQKKVDDWIGNAWRERVGETNTQRIRKR